MRQASFSDAKARARLDAGRLKQLLFDITDIHSPTGATRNVAYEVMALDIMADLVRSGLGIALLPSAVAPHDDRSLATVALRRGPTRTEHLAWSAFNPSPAADAFVRSTAVNG